MAPRRPRRLPAPNCALCDKPLTEVGGYRIVWSTQAGVIVRASHDPLGSLPRRALMAPLPRPHSGALLIWPPREEALERALQQWLDRLHPWACQLCAGQTCDLCGDRTTAPRGCDSLRDDGSVGHFPLVPGPASCIHESCRRRLSRIASRKLLLTAMVLGVCLTTITPDARAELERLVGNYGETIGYLDRRGERTYVKDRCSQTLGYVSKNGSFTDTGLRKAQSPLPYLLLQSERNCAKRSPPD